MTLLWVLVLLFAIGLLTKGADFVLDSAQKIGTWFGLSAFGAGAIIIGSLTSLPDLVAAFVAQLQGASDIVTGTAIGANIADILLIAGIIAILARGVQIVSDDITFDVSWLLVATGALVVMMLDGVVQTGESFFLLTLLVLYFLTTYAIGREKKKSGEHIEKVVLTRKDIVLLGLGFSFLIVGAHLAVDAAIHLAEIFNISTGIIGLFAIALGTTLPEFFVTIRSANGHQAPLAIGNIFGSNVLNALAVVGVPGLLGPIVSDNVTETLGVSVMVLVTILFAWMVLVRKRITKTEGLLFLVGYLVFTLLAAGIL